MNKENLKFYFKLSFFVIITISIIYSMNTINKSILELSEKELNINKNEVIKEDFLLNNEQILINNKKVVDYSTTNASIIRDIVYHLLNIFICLIVVVLIWVTEKIDILKNTNSLE